MDATKLQEVEAAERMTGDEHGEPPEEYDERGWPPARPPVPALAALLRDLFDPMSRRGTRPEDCVVISLGGGPYQDHSCDEEYQHPEGYPRTCRNGHVITGPEGYPRTCRNGHVITGPEGEHFGEHRQCLRCRLTSQRDAQRRYKGTGKGILADVRWNAKKRGGGFPWLIEGPGEPGEGLALETGR